ncbi:MAG TPA: amidohydrolase family protein [Candidatus Aminicenantes bacterium]|nr:amidohydrolase family protein [Candidatus Aminicenantes bacterium]HRY65827.1 amidohydrolase family protein [Candidatus Aminicenantes bacterium]HRZ72847.1 amidohydrolase family protein [Candidatus Aminicenantes bacterium]
MNPFEDAIHAGLPLEGVEIIDMHAHLGPYYNMHIPASGAGDMVRVMDRCGIRRTVVSANVGWDTDIVLGNDMMLQAAAAHPGRLYGACMVNGNHPELSRDELERCFARPEVLIVKIHPWGTGCRLDDRRMKGIYEFASKRGLFVLVHTWYDGDPFGSQDLFAATARDYPQARWIMGHSGGPCGSRRAVELAAAVPNIFLDTTLSMCPARQIEFFVKEVGPERILFGTDNPFIDPRPQIGRVGLADIPLAAKIDIFGANARRHLAF